MSKRVEEWESAPVIQNILEVRDGFKTGFCLQVREAAYVDHVAVSPLEGGCVPEQIQSLGRLVFLQRDDCPNHGNIHVGVDRVGREIFLELRGQRLGLCGVSTPGQRTGRGRRRIPVQGQRLARALGHLAAMTNLGAGHC